MRRKVSRCEVSPAQVFLTAAVFLIAAVFLTAACTRAPAPRRVSNGGAPAPGLLSIADAAAGLELKPPPSAMAWSPDGGTLAWLEPGPDGLSQLVGFDVKVGRVRVLARPLDLVARIDESEEEKAMRERRRQSATGIMQYAWFPDGRRILVPVGRALVVIDLAGAAPRRLLNEDHPGLPAGAPILDVRLAPGGRAVSFTCGGDLYLLDTGDGSLERATAEATKTRFFGLAEFAAQEEMDRHEGAWWSPEGSTIAFTDVDESGVAIRERPDLGEKSAAIVAQRYPSAGTPNAVVRLRYRRRGGAVAGEWRLGAYEYLARVHWLDDLRALVAVQDREQARLRVLSCEVGRADCEALFEEVDPDFVELHADLARLGGGKFLWSSENPHCWRPGPARGRKTLFVIDPKAPRRTSLCASGRTAPAIPAPAILAAGAELVLPGDTTFADVVAVSADGSQVVVGAFAAGGRERRLYLWKPATGETTRLGPPETTWITARFSPDFTRYFAQLGRPGVPDETAIFNLDGTRVHTVVASSGLPVMVPPVEVDVPSSAGGATLNGLLWSPPGVSKVRRPAIIYVYGGPHGQMVQRRLTRHHLWCRAMADAGFFVLMVDGRGGMYRDRAFAKAPRLAFGTYDVQDVRDAVTFLRTVPGLDPARIGLWGWSYGGYLAVAALFRDTGLAAAAAVAPPVDWRLYDTHYTERYLGLPQVHPEAYTSSSVLLDKAPARPLLVIHGMSDDNVLLINSLQLFQKLQSEAVMFDMMLYPGRAHSLWGAATRTHLLLTIVRFFERNL